MKIVCPPNSPLLEEHENQVAAKFSFTIVAWTLRRIKQLQDFPLPKSTWKLGSCLISSTKNIFNFFSFFTKNLRKSSGHRIVMFKKRNALYKKINFKFFFGLLKIIRWLSNFPLQKKFKVFFLAQALRRIKWPPHFPLPKRT